MPGFNCSNCGSDLSLRIDLLAVAVAADYPAGEYPKDLSVEGVCEKCTHSFRYYGEMFTHYLKSKVEEGIISPDVDKFAIVEFDISEEQLEEFQRLTELGDKKKLKAWVTRMVKSRDEE